MSLFAISMRGVKELAAKFGRMPAALDDAQKRGVTRATMIVWRDVRSAENWASRDEAVKDPPGPLRSIHGSAGLLGSIAQTVEKRGGDWTGVVGTKKVYGRIHEQGGEAGPRARRVQIPARPYLGPALERKRAEVLEALKVVVLDEVLGA